MMRERIKRALRITWSNVGPDFEDIGGPVTPELLTELVLDADYAEMYGGDPEAIEALRSMTYDEQDDLALETFITTQQC